MDEVKSLEKKLADLKEAKRIALEKEEYALAATIRDEEKRILQLIDQLELDGKRSNDTTDATN